MADLDRFLREKSVQRGGLNAATVAQLREQDVAVRELEIPHGPCATFTMEAGQRYAVYHLVRPDAVHLFDSRVDP